MLSKTVPDQLFVLHGPHGFLRLCQCEYAGQHWIQRVRQAGPRPGGSGSSFKRY